MSNATVKLTAAASAPSRHPVLILTDAGRAGRRVVVGGVPMQPQLSVMSAFSFSMTESAEETD